MSRARAAGARFALGILIGLLSGATPGRAQSLQWWPEIDVEMAHHRLNVLLLGQVRADAALPDPQLVAAGVVGTLRASSHWKVSAGYLFADLPQADVVAHVPLVAITAQVAPGRWSLAERNRVERLLEYSNEPYRYRNLVRADYMLRKDRKTQLYFANEIIFNVAPHAAFSQNRAQAGMSVPMGFATRLDGYFLERSATGGKQTSVIGTVLTVVLGKGSAR